MNEHLYPDDFAWDRFTGMHLLEHKQADGSIGLAIRIDYYTEHTVQVPANAALEQKAYNYMARERHRWFAPKALDADIKELLADPESIVPDVFVQTIKSNPYYQLWCCGLTMGSPLVFYGEGPPPVGLRNVDLQDIALNDKPIMYIDTRNNTLFNRNNKDDWTRAPMVRYTHLRLGHVDDFTLQAGAAVDDLAPADRAMPEAAGGWGEKTYTMDGLPDGITFDADTRMVSGAPTTAGNSAASYVVTDADGATASADVMFIITAGE